MDLIEFKNGPEGNTPLNKTNMNKLQTNVEDEFNKLINALSNNKETVTGENITINDSAEERVYEYKISGNSKQDGEPTPDIPIEVKSCGDNGCINEVICNKNLAYECLRGKSLNASGVLESGAFDIWFCIVEEGKDYIFNKVGNVFGFYTEKPSSTSITYNNSRFVTSTDTNKFTVPTGSNIKYACIRVAQNSTNIQTEEGSIQTEYEEHKEQAFTIPTQQPMKSINDYGQEIRDTFVKVNGKWYERHYTDRVIFNGAETWQNIQGYGIFYINNINNLKPNTSAETLMGCVSNCFKEIVTSEINAKKEGFCVATTNRLYFFHNGFSPNENLEGFKTWLQEQYNAGTPVYVDYILATPNDIECTSEQIEVLNEINSTAKTYKGTTHFYSTDNVGSNKEIRYVKDIEIMMNK